MKRIICLFFITILVACSAKENAPSNVLSGSEMKSVLWDMMRAQVLAQHNARQDSTINLNAETSALTEKVFKFHKITSKKFDRSYDWYTAHPDIMQVIFDSLYTQKQREFNPVLEDDAPGDERRLLKRSIKEKPVLHE